MHSSPPPPSAASSSQSPAQPGAGKWKRYAVLKVAKNYLKCTYTHETNVWQRKHDDSHDCGGYLCVFKREGGYFCTFLVPLRTAGSARNGRTGATKED